MDAGKGIIETQAKCIHLAPKMFEGQLITISHAAISFRELLDCVVGEMHEGVIGGRVSAGILERTEPHVALFEDVSLEVGSNQHPNSDIEFPVFDEHWLL